MGDDFRRQAVECGKVNDKDSRESAHISPHIWEWVTSLDLCLPYTQICNISNVLEDKHEVCSVGRLKNKHNYGVLRMEADQCVAVKIFETLSEHKCNFRNMSNVAAHITVAGTSTVFSVPYSGKVHVSSCWLQSVLLAVLYKYCIIRITEQEEANVSVIQALFYRPWAVSRKQFQ